MQRSTLTIFLIIVAGFSISAVYAATTIVSDDGIVTSNLVVTGTCSGCGGSEADYSNYNTVLLNSTLGLGSGGGGFNRLFISNNGYVGSIGGIFSLLIAPNGTVIHNDSTVGDQGYQSSDQSETGKYQIVPKDSVNLFYSVYKNGVHLQDLEIDLTQFAGISSNGGASVAISPDGHYIAVIGTDSSNADVRLLIFRGT